MRKPYSPPRIIDVIDGIITVAAAISPVVRTRARYWTTRATRPATKTQFWKTTRLRPSTCLSRSRFPSFRPFAPKNDL